MFYDQDGEDMPEIFCVKSGDGFVINTQMCLCHAGLMPGPESGIG